MIIMFSVLKEAELTKDGSRQPPTRKTAPQLPMMRDSDILFQKTEANVFCSAMPLMSLKVK